MQRPWKNVPAIWYFSALWVVLSVISTGVGLSSLAIPLNENQVLYLFSTTGQVIAAVYGLTLTGFIFFRNELSREEFEDETLAEAVEALKKRYFVLLVFISALVIVTILLSNLAISYESAGGMYWNALMINIGQSAFATSLLAVTYFIFDVISPRRIEKASQSLQEQVDPSRTELTKGSLEEFLKNFNQIEALLEKYGLPYQRVPSPSFERSSTRRLSNVRLAEMLLRDDRIDKLLFHTLRELITLRTHFKMT